MEQPEEKAREIVLSLELFTTGSLDIFGHGSNVDLDYGFEGRVEWCACFVS